MNRLKFLFVAFVFAVFTFGIYSCAKEEEKLFAADLNVESRAKQLEGKIQKLETDPCNCGAIYQELLICRQNCRTNGSCCENVASLGSQYANCLTLTPSCPPGFKYDGANCYSGVHFPPGYNGFVYGNGFYVQRNCNISTANNCCPQGFVFDGANCHYPGLYFPKDHQGFVFNNAFYVKFKKGNCK